jgi:hypothetical protein
MARHPRSRKQQHSERDEQTYHHPAHSSKLHQEYQRRQGTVRLAQAVGHPLDGFESPLLKPLILFAPIPAPGCEVLPLASSPNRVQPDMFREETFLPTMNPP